MAKLVPAILTRDPEEIYEKLKILESVPEVTEFQIDFADGRFVENKTCLPKDLKPFLTRLSGEAHLLTLTPNVFFHDLEHLGFESVVVHYEAFGIEPEIKNALKNGKYLGFSTGLGLNPHTDIEVVKKFEGLLDGVTLMSVHPGFQGQPFLEDTFARLAALRKLSKSFIIEIDGGVNLGNIQALAAHGADRLIVGSGIWHAKNPKKAIHEFLNILSTIH